MCGSYLQNPETNTMELLCKNEAFKKVILADIDLTCRNEGLRGYEIPDKIFLEKDPFSDQNILTVTQKMQRQKALELYGSVVNELLGAPS